MSPSTWAALIVILYSLSSCQWVSNRGTTQKKSLRFQTDVTCPVSDVRNARPNSIEEAVELINALPKPLSLPCFLNALERPLQVYASNSTLSAQPANGSKNPRIFVFSGSNLILSFLIDERDAFLELSTLTSSQTSIKGDLEFPILTRISPSLPYDRIHTNGRTSCGLCHGQERPATQISFAPAFESRAVRPFDRTEVDLDILENENQLCDPTREPERCARLRTLISEGRAVRREFPTSMETFF